MPTRTAEHVAARHAPRRRGHAHPRMPSTVGYMIVSGGLSFALLPKASVSGAVVPGAHEAPIPDAPGVLPPGAEDMF